MICGILLNYRYLLILHWNSFVQTGTELIWGCRKYFNFSSKFWNILFLLRNGTKTVNIQEKSIYVIGIWLLHVKDVIWEIGCNNVWTGWEIRISGILSSDKKIITYDNCLGCDCWFHAGCKLIKVNETGSNDVWSMRTRVIRY